MDELITSISKSKNFYGTDIDIKDFIENIPFLEMKCVGGYIQNDIDTFFKKDKGDVIGYYVCKGQEVFKFYIISVDETVYMALEALPPCMWYKITSYDDFRAVRRAYNKKGSKFNNRLTKIATKLSDNSEMSSISDSISSDYEYVMLIYNMCMNNPFIGGDIFGSNELYDEYLNKNTYNSLERALLSKHIIDKERGFYVRTLYTNSIISIKCVNSILFFSFYYNECPSIENIGTLPLDVYMFMMNFNLLDLEDVIRYESTDSLTALTSSLPSDYYGEMRFAIYKYLSSLEDVDKDSEYIKQLIGLFTGYTVEKILIEGSNELNALKDKTNSSISDYILTKITNDEFKFVSTDAISGMKFIESETLDTISEEITYSDIDNIKDSEENTHKSTSKSMSSDNNVINKKIIKKKSKKDKKHSSSERHHVKS